MEQYEEIKDMLSEAAGDPKELNSIKNFLMIMRQSLRKNKLEGLKKLPPDLKQAVKRFDPRKLIKQAGPDKAKILKLQKEYSSITSNQYFSLVLSYITFLKAKSTGVSPDIVKKKILVQHNNILRKGKTPAVALTILIVTGLWTLLYYSTQTISSNIKLPPEVEKKLPSVLKGKSIPIPLITILVVAFVAGIYFMIENEQEPSGKGSIKKPSEKKSVTSKPSGKRPSDSDEFVL